MLQALPTSGKAGLHGWACLICWDPRREAEARDTYHQCCPAPRVAGPLQGVALPAPESPSPPFLVAARAPCCHLLRLFAQRPKVAYFCAGLTFGSDVSGGGSCSAEPLPTPPSPRMQADLALSLGVCSRVPTCEGRMSGWSCSARRRSDRPCQSLWGFGGQDGPTRLAWTLPEAGQVQRDSTPLGPLMHRQECTPVSGGSPAPWPQPPRGHPRLFTNRCLLAFEHATTRLTSPQGAVLTPCCSLLTARFMCLNRTKFLG